jgi:hypothetical protein
LLTFKNLDKLLDIYYEAYQNVFDKREKLNLAQIISNLIFQRPRIDLETYFTTSYQLEIDSLNLQMKLLNLLSDKMVT